VIWQCGKLYLEDYKKYNSTHVQVAFYWKNGFSVCSGRCCYFSLVLRLFQSCVLWQTSDFFLLQCWRSSN
jgi:hypothetical protein